MTEGATIPLDMDQDLDELLEAFAQEGNTRRELVLGVGVTA